MMHASKRVTEIAGFVAVLYAARRYYRNWGTSKGECQAQLPGDELIGDPVIQVTEAVWIDSPPSVTWPWLLQMGQDRGGPLQPPGVGECCRSADAQSRWSQSGMETARCRRYFATQAERLDGAALTGCPSKSTRSRPNEASCSGPRRLTCRVWSGHFNLQPHWATHTRLLARVRIGLRHPGEVVAVELVRPAIALAVAKSPAGHQAPGATARERVRDSGFRAAL